jgi:ubiquinone/menaquinone biosynthesis C-methylase UbiE
VDGSYVVNVDHVEPAGDQPSIFVVADGNPLPFRPGSFDGVVAMDVLEHLPDPISVLVEIGRVALDDSVLLATVPR